MRRTSEVTDTAFPFAEDTTPFILVIPNGGGKEGRGFEHASTGEKKYDLVIEAQDYEDEQIESYLLAAWPGATRTDVFLVDDLREARDALG